MHPQWTPFIIRSVLSVRNNMCNVREPEAELNELFVSYRFERNKFIENNVSQLKFVLFLLKR